MTTFSEKMVKDLLKWCQAACPDLLKIEIDSQRKQTLLHLASIEGYTEIAKMLIEMGADVNAQDSLSQTPLTLVSHREDNTETMKLLLEKGADVNIPDYCKFSPIHMTCKEGYLEGTRLLLEKGANLETYNGHGYSPFGLGLLKEHKDVCELLLKKEPKLLNKIVDTALGDYPIHVASKGGNSEIIKLLLNKGSYITSKNKEGLSPIHLVTRCGNIRIAKLLIDKLPNVVKDRSKSGQTPLHIGVEYNNLQMVSELLKHDTFVNAQDNEKSTPLHVACKRGNIQIVKLLIEKNAFINIHDKLGLTPLHVAIKNKNPEIVQFLVQKSNCNLNVKDKNGKTALDMAIEENLFDIAKILSKEISKYFDNNVPPGPPETPNPPVTIRKGRIRGGRIVAELNSNECIICFCLKDGIFAFQPCGHAKTCEGCTKNIIQGSDPCPICRKEVKDYQKIFL